LLRRANGRYTSWGSPQNSQVGGREMTAGNGWGGLSNFHQGRGKSHQVNEKSRSLCKARGGSHGLWPQNWGPARSSYVKRGGGGTDHRIRAQKGFAVLRSGKAGLRGAGDTKNRSLQSRKGENGERQRENWGFSFEKREGRWVVLHRVGGRRPRRRKNSSSMVRRKNLPNPRKK